MTDAHHMPYPMLKDQRLVFSTQLVDWILKIGFVICLNEVETHVSTSEDDNMSKLNFKAKALATSIHLEDRILVIS